MGISDSTIESGSTMGEAGERCISRLNCSCCNFSSDSKLSICSSNFSCSACRRYWSLMRVPFMPVVELLYL